MPIDFDTVENHFRVKPGKRFRLADHDPAWAGDEEIAEKKRKQGPRKSSRRAGRN